MKFLRKLKHVFIPSEHNVYRPHLLSKPALLFLLTVVLTAEGVFIADLVARQSALNFLSAVLAGEVITFTNDERAHYSLGQVTESQVLAAAAQAKAEDMAAKGYFSHNGPDGKEPWAWLREAGYEYQYAGENLAVRFTDSRDVVEAWMASPTHKANIVKSAYAEIGVGVARGNFEGTPATFVVQYFGTPRSVAAAIVPTPTEEVLPVASDETEESMVSGEPLALATENPQVEGVADEQPIPEEITAPTAREPVLAAVDAASIRAEQTDSPWSSFARELVRSDVEPSGVILWILAGVATLLVVGLALAFFVHMQVQANDMLMGGAVVAVIAFSFIAFNLSASFTGQKDADQVAAVFGALPAQGGFIDSSAASTAVSR